MTKTIIRLLLAITFSLISISCSTPYQKMSFMGGIEEVQLNANSWRITATGNGYTSNFQVANMTLLRSADIAFQNGFKYFVVLNEKGWNENRGSFTTGTVNPYSFNAVSTSIIRPQSEVIVMMFKENPGDANGIVYETNFICKTLGEKLDAKCGSI